jgi:hypothetical protein
MEGTVDADFNGVCRPSVVGVDNYGFRKITITAANKRIKEKKQCRRLQLRLTTGFECPRVSLTFSFSYNQLVDSQEVVP